VRAAGRIKRAAIPRAGYDYQDLAGIEILIQLYHDPDLYDWVMLEADDSEFRALDDVVAARKDGRFDLIQVKFTVDSERYELDWPWLLDKSSRGTSLLAKWSASLSRVAAMGPVHSAGLKTNRGPSETFAKSLHGTRVSFDLIAKEYRDQVEKECGGVGAAKLFFQTFQFFRQTPDLVEVQSSLRDQLVPSATNMLGWLTLQDSVRKWATFKNQPYPDGRIRRDHVLHIITKKRPQPIGQDFRVPDGYVPPGESFHQRFRKHITDDGNSVCVLWGTARTSASSLKSYKSKARR
jgi:hypothetical protein